MKTSQFCFLLFLAFFIAFVPPFFWPGSPKKDAQQSIKVNDSITRENQQLKKLLNSKMLSMCDTLTIEQKLKISELEDYCSDLWTSQNADEDRAFNKKEAANSQAYNEKEAADMAVFNQYHSEEGRAVLEFERTDPKNFQDYAVIVFKDDKINFGDHMDIYEKRTKMEKLPTIAKYILTDEAAWSKRKSEGQKITAIYDQKVAANEQNYQQQLQAIKVFYQQKIANKRKALGL